jgi:ParB-like chromosome segregation protein Spo0J
MNKSKMKTHWVADMYPLNESDVEPLAESIKANGQRTPILALKDGTIIDGRNRWLACQKAGVEPNITIINPDGEDVPEETLWAIATDCNSMRRDMTSSLRACLAAESWKRLYPEGAPRSGRPIKGESKSKIVLTFEDFAKQSFKVSEAYAKQALAILNHSPELLEDAKNGLAEAYKTYQARAAEDRVKRQNMKLLEDPTSSDIRERVANNNLELEEAITLLRKRHSDEIARIEAESQGRKICRNHFQNLANFLSVFEGSSPDHLASFVIPISDEKPISVSDERPFGRDELLKVAQLLTNTANAIH